MYSSQKLDDAKGSAASGSIKGANCCMKAKSSSDSLTCASESGDECGESLTSKSAPVPG